MQSPSLIHLSEAMTIGLDAVPAEASSLIKVSACILAAEASVSLSALIVNGITEGKPCTRMTEPWRQLHMVLPMPLAERKDDISPHNPDVLPFSITEGKYTLKCTNIPKIKKMRTAVLFYTGDLYFCRKLRAYARA